jgi:hypothetical protein
LPRTFYCFSLNFVYIINRKIHGCLEIPDLFLVLNMISHSFAALTGEISCSTLEINLVFPRTHVLFSIYFALLYILICNHSVKIGNHNAKHCNHNAKIYNYTVQKFVITVPNFVITVQKILITVQQFVITVSWICAWY